MTRPPTPLYRLGRAPDPWAWPDWARAQPGGTFGNRYDDPASSYRVLYACSQRRGTFVETLARFRPDPVVAAGLAAITSNEQGSGPGGSREGGQDDALPPGVVPRSWLARRRMGTAGVAGAFADVGHSATLAHLNRALADRLRAHGLDEVDAAAIRRSAPRAFTQEVSRHLYERTSAEGRREFAGVAYRSRLGDELDNWAVFEPADITVAEVAEVARDDADLADAMRLHGLRWADDPT